MRCFPATIRTNLSRTFFLFLRLLATLTDSDKHNIISNIPANHDDSDFPQQNIHNIFRLVLWCHGCGFLSLVFSEVLVLVSRFTHVLVFTGVTVRFSSDLFFYVKVPRSAFLVLCLGLAFRCSSRGILRVWPDSVGTFSLLYSHFLTFVTSTYHFTTILITCFSVPNLLFSVRFSFLSSSFIPFFSHQAPPSFFFSLPPSFFLSYVTPSFLVPSFLLCLCVQ
jgi:hypothetical protein